MQSESKKKNNFPEQIDLPKKFIILDFLKL